MAHISVNVASPVSFHKESLIARVANGVSEVIVAYKAKRQARRVEKVLASLDPRIVRDIIPQ